MPKRCFCARIHRRSASFSISPPTIRATTSSRSRRPCLLGRRSTATTARRSPSRSSATACACSTCAAGRRGTNASCARCCASTPTWIWCPSSSCAPTPTTYPSARRRCRLSPSPTGKSSTKSSSLSTYSSSTTLILSPTGSSPICLVCAPTSRVAAPWPWWAEISPSPAGSMVKAPCKRSCPSIFPGSLVRGRHRLAPTPSIPG